MTEQKPRSPEMYFSVDCEFDGEAPSVASLLSIGIVAIDPFSSTPREEFYRTLKRIPENRPNNRMMEWWDQFPKQWAETRANPIDPAEAMRDLHNWVVDVCKKIKKEQNLEVGPTPIFVASPAASDFCFVFCYLHKYLDESIFGFSAFDIQSYAAALLNCPYRAAGKKDTWPDDWKSPLPHTHNALEDAREQADIFLRMKRWRQARRFVIVTNNEDAD